MKSWRSPINLLWFSQLLCISLMEMSGPFWPLFLRELPDVGDNIETWSACIYAAPLLISGFVTPFWGRMGDRYGHKAMLLRAITGLAVTQGALCFCDTVWQVLCWRMLQGALAGVITAALCYATAIAPEQHRSRVIGHLTSATAGGAILGPVLGGFLIQWLNFQALFALSALFCLTVSCVLTFRLERDEPPAYVPIKIRSGVGYSSKYALIFLMFAIFLMQAAKALPSSWFALFAEQQLSVTPFITGLIFSSAGVGMMISAPMWGKRFDNIEPKERLIKLAFISSVAATCYLMHLYSDWLGLIIIRFVWGICLGAMLPILQATMIHLMDSHKKGDIIGQAQRFIKFGNLAGVAIGALVLHYWDFQGGFVFAAVVYVVVSFVLVLATFWLRQSSSSTEPV